MIPLTPRSTLFPYTTLFRSHLRHADVVRDLLLGPAGEEAQGEDPAVARREPLELRPHGQHVVDLAERTEEHTSELQSRQYLVCRLLLEKKTIRRQNTSDC